MILVLLYHILFTGVSRAARQENRERPADRDDGQQDSRDTARGEDFWADTGGSVQSTNQRQSLPCHWTRFLSVVQAGTAGFFSEQSDEAEWKHPQLRGNEDSATQGSERSGAVDSWTCVTEETANVVVTIFLPHSDQQKDEKNKSHLHEARLINWWFMRHTFLSPKRRSRDDLKGINSRAFIVSSLAKIQRTVLSQLEIAVSIQNIFLIKKSTIQWTIRNCIVQNSSLSNSNRIKQPQLLVTNQSINQSRERYICRSSDQQPVQSINRSKQRWMCRSMRSLSLRYFVCTVFHVNNNYI